MAWRHENEKKKHGGKVVPYLMLFNMQRLLVAFMRIPTIIFWPLKYRDQTTLVGLIRDRENWTATSRLSSLM